jgi:hypothetical protein
MVKVVVNNAKGLVQYSGSGLELGNPITGNAQATGMEFIKLGAIQSLNADANYDDELALPAGATVVDVGVQFLTICTTANVHADDQIAFKCGLSAGGVEIVAATDIVERNKSGAAGSMQTVQLANKAETTANAFATFPDAALLRDAAGAARSIHTRFVVEARALAVAGTARAWVKYVIT